MYTQVQSSFTSLSLKQAINIKNCLALMGIRHYKVYVTGGPENLNKQKLMTQSSRNGKYFNPTWIPKYHMIPVNRWKSRISSTIKRSIICTSSSQKLSMLTTFSDQHLLTPLLEVLTWHRYQCVPYLRDRARLGSRWYRNQFVFRI